MQRFSVMCCKGRETFLVDELDYFLWGCSIADLPARGCRFFKPAPCVYGLLGTITVQ